MGKILSHICKAAAGGLIHAAYYIKQCGFAAARLSKKNKKFTFIDIKVDPFKHLGNYFTVFKLTAYIAERNNHFSPMPRHQPMFIVRDGHCRHHNHDFAHIGVLFCERTVSRSGYQLNTAQIFVFVGKRHANHGPYFHTVKIRRCKGIGGRLKVRYVFRLLGCVYPAHSAFAGRMGSGHHVKRAYPVIWVEPVLIRLVRIPDDRLLCVAVFYDYAKASLKSFVKGLCISYTFLNFAYSKVIVFYGSIHGFFLLILALLDCKNICKSGHFKDFHNSIAYVCKLHNALLVHLFLSSQKHAESCG